jgi:hypothetical protein
LSIRSTTFNAISPLAGEVSNVSGCAAHVEADDLVDAGLLRSARRADDAARGTGENRVLAVELLGVGETARRLHELQLHAGELRGHLIHIASQDWRKVSVHRGRIAARDELHQRADLV